MPPNNRNPLDPLGLLAHAQAMPVGAVEVEISPTFTVMLENQDPRKCPDPRLACMVLSLSQHMNVLKQMDVMFGNAITAIDYLVRRVAVLESLQVRAVPEDPMREQMAARLAGIAEFAEKIREVQAQKDAQSQKQSSQGEQPS